MKPRSAGHLYVGHLYDTPHFHPSPGRRHIRLSRRKSGIRFCIHEWTIIYIIDYLQGGFVHRYSRGAPMTSRPVKDAFQSMVGNPTISFAKVSQVELQACCDEFERLTVKRNALIHAHPCTDSDGAQILAYQTKVTKPLPDMKWPRAEVEAIIKEFDVAACSAGSLLDRLR